MQASIIDVLASEGPNRSLEIEDIAPTAYFKAGFLQRLALNGCVAIRLSPGDSTQYNLTFVRVGEDVLISYFDSVQNFSFRMGLECVSSIHPDYIIEKASRKNFEWTAAVIAELTRYLFGEDSWPAASKFFDFETGRMI